MVDIPFFKKFTLPSFSFDLGRHSPSFLGVDIGGYSVKVVQLRKEKERAVLETYGELKTGGYLKRTSGAAGSNFLRFLEADVTEILKESNVTTHQAVFSIPPISSFITVVDFPRLSPGEIQTAIPYEAKKYIPIPLSEVLLDWEVIDEGDKERVKILLVAVPKEVISKYKRIAQLSKLELRALEIENFSLVRSLVGPSRNVVAIINFGAYTTTVCVVDQGTLRLNHNIERGFHEITRTMVKALNISEERAEEFKKTVGLSEKPEEKEGVDVILGSLDALMRETERIVNVYNRANMRKVEQVILTGGGTNLFGLVDYAAKTFGLETIRANPFARLVYPAFLQPILHEIGPSFSTAVGLALREITSK